MGMLSRFFPPKAPQNAVVARQISNIHWAQTILLDDRGKAARAVMDGVIDWLQHELATDANPEASAREICREILARVADAQRGAGGSSAA